ncbi:MAG: uracil-DNA glycosylase [Nitrososphaerota archaeon]|nr:uracil-DNA glycosylase [Nitrososphaerota archaeon]
MKQPSSLDDLNRKLVTCKKCTRLVEFREKVAKEKRKQYLDFDYWGKPVPGYGDPKAKLVVLGLAPAAHGGNRTGRVFTGDNSARFLVKHLHEAGFANQPTSETRNDGLEYTNCYVTAAVKCVPPKDKPARQEIINCAPYLEYELALLRDSRAVLCLGKVAFDWMVLFMKKYHGIKGIKFEHGKKYETGKGVPTLFASYHPSPRNTNTGKLTSKMFSELLSQVREYVESASTNTPSIRLYPPR